MILHKIILIQSLELKTYKVVHKDQNKTKRFRKNLK